MLQQIFRDMTVAGDCRPWLSGNEGLHVHVAVKDKELDVFTVQNLMVLYGIMPLSPRLHHIMAVGRRLMTP